MEDEGAREGGGETIAFIIAFCSSMSWGSTVDHAAFGRRAQNPCGAALKRQGLGIEYAGCSSQSRYEDPTYGNPQQMKVVEDKHEDGVRAI